MAKKQKETELILNPDGSIYHLHLRPEHIARKIILVGDPQRVDVLSSQFETLEYKISNREFVTHTGTYKGSRITVLGTGIGTDNMDIVINELDALVNIDLETRHIKDELTRLSLVRLGTTGLLQADIPVDTFIASEWGLGMDALLHFYKEMPGVIDPDLTTRIEAETVWNMATGGAYAVKASAKLLKTIAFDMQQGITLTSPGFYGPQGRVLRLAVEKPHFIDQVSDFSYEGKRVLNFEMETSALYGLGKMLGHDTLTVCVAIANRRSGAFSKVYKETIRSLSTIVLDRLAAMDPTL